MKSAWRKLLQLGLEGDVAALKTLILYAEGTPRMAKPEPSDEYRPPADEVFL